MSTGNSLHGSATNDEVGLGGVLALSDGNYVVQSHAWSNQLGAATWGDGASGIVGAVGSGNSLVGTTAGDSVGSLGVALSGNGSYVISSPSWSSQKGAVTWCAAGGCVAGQVNAGNSLTGVTSSQNVGAGGAFALSGGNYVVASPAWGNGVSTAVGAATWGDGSAGLTGPVSTSNSVTGGTANDQIGSGGVAALANNTYVVASPTWHDGGGTPVGAVTWVSADHAFSTVVTPFNSLTGSTNADGVGFVRALSDGNYVVYSQNWHNGSTAGAGAVTLASGRYRLVGRIASWNSVLGGIANGGATMVYAYDPTRKQLAVGRPAENIVSLFTMDQIFADNLEQ